MSCPSSRCTSRYLRPAPDRRVQKFVLCMPSLCASLSAAHCVPYCSPFYKTYFYVIYRNIKGGRAFLTMSVLETVSTIDIPPDDALQTVHGDFSGAVL